MRIILSAVAALAILTTAARGDTLLQYAFTTDLNPTTVAVNATGSAVAAAPKVNNQVTTTLSIANGVGYPTQPFLATARGTANESGNRPDVYFTFTLSAAPGYALSLTDLSFNVARGGSSGTRDYDIRSSVDNYAGSLTGASPVVISALRPDFGTAVDLDLTAAQFQNLSTITYRFRFFTTGVSQNVDWDNITVNGTVTPLPEPTIATATLIAGLALLRRRGRRGTISI